MTWGFNRQLTFMTKVLKKNSRLRFPTIASIFSLVYYQLRSEQKAKEVLGIHFPGFVWIEFIAGGY